MRERDFRCFALVCFTLLFLCVCALTEWCLGWWFYTCPCTAHTSFSFMLNGLRGWSLLITLIAFLGFGLWEALEEYQKKRGAFMPFVPLLKATVPSSTAAKLAEAVSLGFSLSRRVMAVVSCCCPRCLNSPCWLPYPCPFLVPHPCSSLSPYLCALSCGVPD